MNKIESRLSLPVVCAGDDTGCDTGGCFCFSKNSGCNGGVITLV